MDDMQMANHVDDMDAFLDQMPQPEPEEQGEPCPVCGSLPGYCLGHDAVGDPYGASILAMHEQGDHEDCHWAAPCRADEKGPAF